MFARVEFGRWSKRVVGGWLVVGIVGARWGGGTVWGDVGRP